jgi:hypothetical protein
VTEVQSSGEAFHARVRIDTSDFDRVPGGLPIDPDHEDIDLLLSDRYPNRPPLVGVDHTRFAGHPHVLVGSMLCIYLDEDREWHPALGAAGVMARLLEWLADAAADRFDARTALHHPIGGVLPSPLVRGTLVASFPNPANRPSMGRATTLRRTDARCDLLHWGTRTASDPSLASEALIALTAEPMPLGHVEVETLGELAARIEHAGGPDRTTTISSSARLLTAITDGTFRLIVDIAHPTDPTLSYLACAIGPAPPPTADPNIAQHLPNMPIRWILVSDERPNIATRRDSQRPTAVFAGKAVEIWGCGGLGSWIGEFIVRAGAAQVLLRDTRSVQRGLLVRQNYTEADVGEPKATQLAARLTAISDGCTVEAAPGSALDVLAEGFDGSADILIDATINVTVAARLDEWARSTSPHPLLAQVATDPRSATLGLLIVVSSDAILGPATVDDATWTVVEARPELERFHGFWTSPAKSDQIVPALGCSTPTFHGSAADLASIAGSLTSLLAGHVDTALDGAHLIESAHARGPGTDGHVFIPFSTPGAEGEPS